MQGKISVVQILGDVAELFAVFEKERLVYGSMSTHRRKKTTLVLQGLKQVKLDLAELGTLMARVSEMVIRPDLILTLAGSDVINAKLKALTVLTLKLAIFEGQLRKVLKSRRFVTAKCMLKGLNIADRTSAFVVTTHRSFSGRSLWSFRRRQVSATSLWVHL